MAHEGLNAATRAQRIVRATALTEDQKQSYAIHIEPLIMAEHDHMQEQGYVFPFQSFDQTMNDVREMTTVRNHLVYRQPMTMIVPELLTAHEKDGDAGVINSFAGLIAKTQSYLGQQIVHHKQDNALAVARAAVAIDGLDQLIAAKQAKQNAPGFQARLANTFDRTNIPEKSAEIDRIVEDTSFHLNQIVGYDRGKTHAKEAILFVTANEGFPFRSLPVDYAARRLAALGIETPVAETATPAGHG